MSFVHTALGPGRIVAEDSVRGRRSFLVEGSGFKTWIDEADAQIEHTAAFGDGPSHLGDHAPTNKDLHKTVNDDNSVTLPYDPTPQFHVDGFRTEQTIQPDHLIDADERTSPANSLTFKTGPQREYPGPAPHLFAKGAAHDHRDEYYCSNCGETLDKHDAEGHCPPETPLYYHRAAARYAGWEDEVHEKHQQQQRLDPEYQRQHQLLEGWGGYPSRDPDDPNSPYYVHPDDKVQSVEELLMDPEDDDVPEFGDLDVPDDYGYDRANDVKEMAMGYGHPESSPYGEEYQHYWDEGGNRRPDAGPWQDPDKGPFPERRAGLSDKYIQVEADVDHYNDPVQRFRDDPQGYIQRHGHLNSDSYNIRIAEYAELVDSDPMLRLAAWNDVRRKAQRLRRDGKVEVKEASNNRIMATVHGDSDDYEVMILTGGYGGGSPAISDWHCDCDWGQWAFRRQAMYIGRLCSHGYAAYLEMQSRAMKGKGTKKKGHRTAAPSMPKIPTPDIKAVAEGAKEGAGESAKTGGGVGAVEQTKGSEVMDTLKSMAGGTAGNLAGNAAPGLLKAPVKALTTELGAQAGPHGPEGIDVGRAVASGAGALAGGLMGGFPGEMAGSYLGDKAYDAIPELAAQNMPAPPMANPASPAPGQETQSYVNAGAPLPPPVLNFTPSGGSQGRLGWRRVAGVIEDFKKWVDENHNGHLDLPLAQEFLAEHATDEDEAQQVYDYVEGHGVEGVERDYDVPYTDDVEEVYKDAARDIQAELLSTRPGRMAPVFTYVEDEGGEQFVDVEKDERKTTGPDQIQHFSSLHEAGDEWIPHIKGRPRARSGPGRAKPGGESGRRKPVTTLTGPAYDEAWNRHIKNYGDKLRRQGLPEDEVASRLDERQQHRQVAAARFYASGEGADGLSNQVIPQYRDFDGGGKLLKKLRQESDVPPEDDFGNMRERNDDIRDIVEELHEKGFDADQFVASRHYAQGTYAAPAAMPQVTTPQVTAQPGVPKLRKPGQGTIVQPQNTWGSNTLQKTRTAGDAPFEGSGGRNREWIGTSEDYVNEHEKPRYEDLELGDDDIIKYTGHPPQGPGKKGSYDPIANFYKSGAAEAIRHGSSNSGGHFSDAAIADQARGFLRTAGRNFSMAEQRELEDEFHERGARNLDGLDLAGTHYEDD